MKGVTSVILAGIVILVIVAGTAVYYGSITGFFAFGPAQENGNTENVSEPDTGGTGLVIGEPLTETPSGTEPGTPPESEPDNEAEEEQIPVTGGGGSGTPPSGGGCIDTSWTPQGDWSECSPDGKQTRTLRSNCGRTKTETQDCTYIWISPEIQQANVGDNVTVDVKINTTGKISGFDIQIDFNPSVLEALDMGMGSFLGQDGAEILPISSKDNELGRVQFAAVRVGEIGVSGEGVLITVTFKSKLEGYSNLTLQNVEIITTLGNMIKILAKNATVNVV